MMPSEQERGHWSKEERLRRGPLWLGEGDDMNTLACGVTIFVGVACLAFVVIGAISALTAGR